MHVLPTVAAGKFAITNGVDAASCYYFKIMIEGISSHISKPHQGRNALQAAAQIALQLPMLTTRINPLENAIVSVGHLESGKSGNISASNAV